jgi:CheY-like chemotaxis protein
MAKIVFCEDEALIQKLVRTMLRSSPHELFIASNGLEGLEVVERERPDLIFTDVSMPQCNGFDFADTLKSREHLAHIPIVFVTALALRTEVEEGFKHDVVSYLTKPFTASDLFEKIETFCNL